MKPRLFADMVELETDHWWLVGRRRLLAALIAAESERRLGPVRRWVDVGSGTGALLREFGPLAAEMIGVESDPIPLEISRARGVRVLEAPAEHLPFEDESVDLLTAFDVLEHLDDDVVAIREFARVLEPGGMAIVSVPAYAWLWSAHDEVHGHRRRYTTASLTAALDAGGMRARRVGYFNAFLFPIEAAARLIERVSGRAGASDLRRVPQPLNRVLLRVFASERRQLLRGGFPFGLSVLAVIDRE